MKVILQWVLAAVALLAVGPVAGWATSAHRGIDGSAHATMLVGASPVSGVLGHLGALALAAAMGVVSARLVSGRYGLFAAGMVLAWGAARTGRVEEVLAAQPTSGVLMTLAVEGLVLAVVVAGLAWLVCRDTYQERAKDRERALSGETALGVASALVAGSVGAWLAAQDDVKGQTIAAAVVAGALGATLARVLAHRCVGWAVVLGVCLGGVVGPLLGLSASAGQVLEGLYSGGISTTAASLARIAPLDWAAGALMGAPVGMSWAASMVEKKVEEASGKPERA